MNDRSEGVSDNGGASHTEKNNPVTRNPSPQDRPLITPDSTREIPDELLEKIPEEIRGAVIEIVRSKSFSGPLPPPEMLGEYENALTGAAKRIFRMAETEQAHRHSWETGALGAVERGQRFGFIIAIVAIIAASAVAYAGNTTAAVVIAGGGLLGPLWAVLRKFLARDGEGA